MQEKLFVTKERNKGMFENGNTEAMRDFKHTSNSYGGGSLFSSGQEDDVLLRRIDVVIFQNEYFIDAMFLKRGELDKYADWTSQSLFYHEILLSPDLALINIHF